MLKYGRMKGTFGACALQEEVSRVVVNRSVKEFCFFYF